MATKKAHAQAKAPDQHNGHQPDQHPHDIPPNQSSEQGTPTQTTPTPPPPRARDQQRADDERLAAQGLRRCVSHAKWFPGEDSVRPVSEFWAPSATAKFQGPVRHCRACHRAGGHASAERKARGEVQPAARSRTQQEATLAKLIAQRDALTVRIDAVQASLAATQQQASEQEQDE